MPDFNQFYTAMGNAEKRRKRAKIKAKESRVRKHSEPSPFPYLDVTYPDKVGISDEVEALFKTLPPFTLEFEALPSIKRFVENKGNVLTPDKRLHVQQLTAIFALWCEGDLLYTLDIIHTAEILGRHPDFLSAYYSDEPALSLN